MSHCRPAASQSETLPSCLICLGFLPCSALLSDLPNGHRYFLAFCLEARLASACVSDLCCCVQVCHLLNEASQGLGVQQPRKSSQGVAGNSNQQRQLQTPEQRQASLRARLVKKFSAKSAVYENCKMFSQDGELLCFCDMRKLTWYEVCV